MSIKEVDVGEWANYEPVVNDVRLANVEGKLRNEYDKVIPEDIDFVTFVQPPREVTREDGLTVPLPAMAVFAVISDNPKHKGYRVMTNATAHLSAWYEALKEFQHFSGAPDPLIGIFRTTLEAHLRTIQNLREMN